MDVTESNCTVVTGLFNINRESWSDYKRNWATYLEYFKNTLTLKSKFVIYVEKNTIEFVIKERKKVDPNLEFSKIIEIPFNKLPKYYLRSRIDEIMNSIEYKQGLIDPNPPEYNNPDYVILILSKMWLVEDAIKNNYYNTDYYMWVDAGIKHSKFRESDKGIIYPNISKINDIKGIRILCRTPPQENDLNIKKFYRSHINRFGAGVILGNKTNIIQFNEKMDGVIEEALNNNLIDSEQSLHTVCYLRNKDMFELIYNNDWYYHFDLYI